MLYIDEEHSALSAVDAQLCSELWRQSASLVAEYTNKNPVFPHDYLQQSYRFLLFH